MVRWPNFFIVGAARAGTTSLHHYLRQHPDIYMPSIKELHFFSQVDSAATRLRYLGMTLTAKEEDYLRFFAEATDEQAVGDACSSYLYDAGAPSHMKATVPQAKIIMLLRDPVERAYSHYLAGVREGDESRPFYEALVEDYAAPRKIWGAAHLYVDLGLYYEQVRRYLETFDAERVRIYLYEDLVSDTAGLVRDVCAFVNLPSYNGRFFDPDEKYNTYAAPRTTLFQRLMGMARVRSLAVSLVPKQLLVAARDRLLLAKAPKPAMDPRALDFLCPIYHDDLLKLQRLIGRDLRGWLGRVAE